jgi:hypothetical protein
MEKFPKTIKQSFDPKNREVLLVQTAVKEWRVEKPDAGFVSKAYKSLNHANGIYSQQIESSQTF